jgi:hypothetical protein
MACTSGTSPVCLVHLVSLMRPDKPDRPNRPNEQDRLADFFSIRPDCIRLAAGEHRDFFVGLLSLLSGTAVV